MSPEDPMILGDFDFVGKARKRPLWQISVFIFLSPGRHAAPVPFVALLPPPVALLSPCRPFDLDNSFGICYRRVSLAPAREFEVKANCFNFGVSSGDATQILSCLILVLPLVFGRGRYGEKQFSTKG